MNIARILGICLNLSKCQSLRNNTLNITKPQLVNALIEDFIVIYKVFVLYVINNTKNLENFKTLRKSE